MKKTLVLCVVIACVCFGWLQRSAAQAAAESQGKNAPASAGPSQKPQQKPPAKLAAKGDIEEGVGCTITCDDGKLSCKADGAKASCKKTDLQGLECSDGTNTTACNCSPGNRSCTTKKN